MDKDNFLEKIKEIGTCEDIEEVRTKLVSLTEDVSKVYEDAQTDKATIDSLNESLKKKEEETEKLREYNMELFKRLPVSKSEEEIKADTTGIKEEPKKEFKSYEELAKRFM